jgi:hypothetical protein
VLETEIGTIFLSAAISPDARYLALLKRVMRGSMPTDAVGLYDCQTFQRIAVIEVQIAFQRVPTFTIAWSADGTHLVVPYNVAGRTLFFGVNGTHTLSLQSIAEHASFQFHPIHADIALYATMPPAPNQVSIVQIVGGLHEQLIETMSGTDAQWSPDGTKLAYLGAMGTQGHDGLIIRDEATKQIRSVPVPVQDWAWSPDSRRLAVYCLARNDPLNIGTLLPPNAIPGWQLGALEPRLLIYDAAIGGAIMIGQLRQGFQLAHLQWLNRDWLLVMDVQAKFSFMTDRRGEQRIPVTALTDFTPLILWMAQVS